MGELTRKDQEMRIELPSGGWVELRERVTNKDRKRYVNTMENGPREDAAVVVPTMDADGEPVMSQKIGPGGIGVLDDHGDPVMEPATETRIVKQPTWFGAMEVNSMILGLLVESWSFDGAPSEETLDELLDVADYDALAAAATPIVKKLFVNTKPSPDVESPSEPFSV